MTYEVKFVFSYIVEALPCLVPPRLVAIAGRHVPPYVMICLAPSCYVEARRQRSRQISPICPVPLSKSRALSPLPPSAALRSGV